MFAAVPLHMNNSVMLLAFRFYQSQILNLPLSCCPSS